MNKILLIEDDKVMRENTAEILELASFTVTTAENGKKGVQLAKELRPDLIICDIMMPELDGYGVLHVLSKDPATASIPFIFLTAKAEKSEMRKGMELGADDYLTKPFEDTELLNAVESRLKKSALLRKEFGKDVAGLNRFLEEAKGLKELDGLSLNRPVFRYKKKDTVFYEGDTPEHLFFLNRGRIKTHKAREDDKEYVTSVYNAGEFFGYVSLLQNAVYADSAVALEDCEICKIPKTDFTSLVFKNRDVAVKFIKMLSNNVAERESKLLSLAYDTVKKRVADALISLRRNTTSAPVAGFRVTVTRDDLAGMAGTATETVIRSLSDLKAEKLIEMDGRDIVVLDPKGLEHLKW